MNKMYYNNSLRNNDELSNINNYNKYVYNEDVNKNWNNNIFYNRKLLLLYRIIIKYIITCQSIDLVIKFCIWNSNSK